jgi:LCP family protein required for cell wall assembly
MAPVGLHSRQARARKHIPARRWPRRVLVTANVFAAMGIIVVGSAYGYAKWRFDSIRTLDAPHLVPAKKVANEPKGGAANGLLPENILLIGNETRAGLSPSDGSQYGSSAVLTGSLSDVIMVLHIDPASNTASILSIPRDLFVPMPAGSPVGPFQKIDAALNDGSAGPDQLIQAVEDDLGIPINHFMELDFDGFQQTVNALGGIKLNFPERLYDGVSLLNIETTGCQLIDGKQALALVRSRELQYDPPGFETYDPAAWPYDPESDLSRIVRDHTFLRVLASTAESKGLTNPIEVNNLISAVINQITIDPGLKGQLIPLLEDYHALNPATAPETTIPITSDNVSYYYAGNDIGDVDFPVQPTDDNVIKAWDRDALPTPVAPTGVEIDNISGTYTAAQQVATGLTSEGLHILGTTTLSMPATETETLVRYYPGQVAQAMDVMQHLAGAVMLQSDSTVTPGTVDLDVGTSVAVLPPSTPATTTTPTTAPTTTTTAPATDTSTAPTTPTTAAPTTTTTVPTIDGLTPSSSADVEEPWDPQPCT